MPNISNVRYPLEKTSDFQHDVTKYIKKQTDVMLKNSSYMSKTWDSLASNLHKNVTNITNKNKNLFKNTSDFLIKRKDIEEKLYHYESEKLKAFKDIRDRVHEAKKESSLVFNFKGIIEEQKQKLLGGLQAKAFGGLSKIFGGDKNIISREFKLLSEMGKKKTEEISERQRERQFQIFNENNELLAEQTNQNKVLVELLEDYNDIHKESKQIEKKFKTSKTFDPLHKDIDESKLAFTEQKKEKDLKDADNDRNLMNETLESINSNTKKSLIKSAKDGGGLFGGLFKNVKNITGLFGTFGPLLSSAGSALIPIAPTLLTVGAALGAAVAAGYLIKKDFEILSDTLNEYQKIKQKEISIEMARMKLERKGKKKEEESISKIKTKNEKLYKEVKENIFGTGGLVTISEEKVKSKEDAQNMLELLRGRRAQAQAKIEKDPQLKLYEEKIKKLRSRNIFGQYTDDIEQFQKMAKQRRRTLSSQLRISDINEEITRLRELKTTKRVETKPIMSSKENVQTLKNIKQKQIEDNKTALTQNQDMVNNDNLTKTLINEVKKLNKKEPVKVTHYIPSTKLRQVPNVQYNT